MVMVWCVVADAGGAHEAECVYSMWSTQDSAEREIVRLVTEGVEIGCYGGRLTVTPVQLDKPSNEWIGF